MNDKRGEFTAALAHLHTVICSMGIGDIDGESRAAALDSLSHVRECVIGGLDERKAEREREEEKRIIKAYREGKLVERA